MTARLPVLFYFLATRGLTPGRRGCSKQRIEEAPEARKRGLKVWFDKDDLRAGKSWQKQLVEAIGQQATAFAVYVGSRGVINWVEAEVRLGLSARGNAAGRCLEARGGNKSNASS